MCRSVDIALANSRAEGLSKGRIDGRKEERVSIIVRQLKKKLESAFSKETADLVRNACFEQLDNIAMNIFEIENETDILEIT